MKGLAQALIVSAREAFKGSTPMDKITPLGYLQYLLSNTKPVIKDYQDMGDGYFRDVKVRYMQRAASGLSVQEDNCSIQTRQAYLDKTIPVTQFRALGIAFDDDLISKFEKDALGVMNVGTPVTAIMNEVWDAIIANANGLFTDIDKDLTTIQSANFGVNIASNSNAARNVNFAINGTNNDLTQGMTQVMADAMINESRLDGSSIVGSGLILNYALQQRAKTGDQSGVNTSLLALPDFKYDNYTGPLWGANNFGLFEKDAVQFINIARFRGTKAGLKGGDYFFTMKLPIADSVGQGSFKDFEFDVQLTYRTCPEEVQIGNELVSLGRGWNVILMSSYTQFNIPTDAYMAGDRLFGNNGTYLYHATNA